jgi:pimeloyl-ACP methyl ester carboxylesterase
LKTLHNPLHPVFGTVANAGKQPFVFLRHGFASNGSIFQSLEIKIKADFSHSQVDRTTYIWQDPVVINGLKLAVEVMQVPESIPVYLVGHSMGGLISRVAAAALTDPQAMLQHLSSVSFAWNFEQEEAKALCSSIQQRTIAGLLTLAIPNCGAVTHGQTALLAYFFRKAFSTKARSLVDLTTDHLFRFLQRYSVDIPTLSISASGVNSFSTRSRAPFKIAIGLRVPHDGIVEDVSVDLNQSVLPNEVINSLSARYLHIRAYPDCTDVWHTTIHGDLKVQQFVSDFIALT